MPQSNESVLSAPGERERLVAHLNDFIEASEEGGAAADSASFGLLLSGSEAVQIRAAVASHGVGVDAAARERVRQALTSAAHNGDLLITAGNREDFIDDVLAALSAA